MFSSGSPVSQARGIRGPSLPFSAFALQPSMVPSVTPNVPPKAPLPSSRRKDTRKEDIGTGALMAMRRRGDDDHATTRRRRRDDDDDGTTRRRHDDAATTDSTQRCQMFCLNVLPDCSTAGPAAPTSFKPLQPLGWPCLLGWQHWRPGLSLWRGLRSAARTIFGL